MATNGNGDNGSDCTSCCTEDCIAAQAALDSYIANTCSYSYDEAISIINSALSHSLISSDTADQLGNLWTESCGTEEGWKCTSHADCSFGCCDSYGMCGGSKPCGDDDDDPESTVPELSYSDSVGRENIYDEIPETTKDVTPRTITETAYYILKGVTIPLGVSLKLEEEDVMFKISEYELRIKLSAGDSDVDVMIDLTNNKFTDDEYIY